MNPEAIPVGSSVLGGFNHAGQVLDGRPDKLQCLALQVGGWAMVQCPIPVKRISLPIPDTLFKIAGREVWMPYAQQSMKR